MKTELKELILKRIKDKKLKAFSCYDFTDLASYKTINKCLERLEDNGQIKRIVNGIFCLSLYDRKLGLPVYPSVNEVVNCLARKNKWIVCPTGNMALNLIGVSNQIPAKYVFLSNGPYKKYIIYGIEVILKHTMNRELFDCSYKTLVLIQSIKAFGEKHFGQYEIEYLKNKMSPIDKKAALNETSQVQSWIRNIVVKICEE